MKQAIEGQPKMNFLKRLWENLRRHRTLSFLAVSALLVAAAMQVSASVMVAPTVVFLSERSRTGRIIVQNPADEPTEVTVRFSFGLPFSDSLGNVQVALQDSGVTDPRSALDWMKAFPRKVIIPARGSQVIRLIARPPSDLPDGEYWARIVVSSRENNVSIPTSDNPENISTHLNMVMQMAIMVKYRTGELVSNLELKNVQTAAADSTVSVMLDMSNRGNVSYMGVLHATLYDADGKKMNESASNVAVYRDLRRRVDLFVPDGEFRKPYNVSVMISSDGRTDVPPQDLIKGNKIEYSANIE